MSEQVTRLELFTPDDASYLLNLIESIGSSQSYVVVLTEEELLRIDLSALASELHGLTDPIGQLKKWIYDRMKELASWFGKIVGSVWKDLWNMVAKPIIEAIRNTVDAIWNFLTSVPGAVKDFISWIGDQITQVWSWIQNNIVQPLLSVFQTLTQWIQDAIRTITTFFTTTLPSWISQIPDMIQGALQRVWSWIQTYIIEPLQSAFGELTNLVQNAISTLSQLPKIITSALQGAWNWIQTYIVKPLTSAFETLTRWVSTAVNTLVNFFTKQLPSWISQLPSMIQGALQKAWGWIQQYIIEPITNAFQTLVNWVRQGIETLASFFTKTLPGWLSQLCTSIQNAMRGAWTWIQTHIVEPITKAFQTFAAWIEKGIDTLINFFTKLLPSWLSQIPNTIQNLLRSAWIWIQQHVVAPLTSAFRTLATWIQQGIESLTNFFTELLPRWLSQIPSMIQGALRSVWTWIQRYVVEPVTTAFRTVATWISQAVDVLRKLFTEELPSWLSQIPNMLRSVVASAWSFIEAHIVEPLTNVFRRFAGFIATAVDTIRNFLAKQLPSLVQAIARELTQLPQKVFEGLKVAGMTLWDWLTRLGTAVQQGFEQLWRAMETVGNYLMQVGVYLTGFINAILKFPEWFPKWFYNNIAKPIVDAMKQIGKFFWETVPDWLRKGLEGLANLFSQLWQNISEFFTNAWSWIQKHLVSPAWSALQWVWSQIVSGVQWLAKEVWGFVQWLATEFWSALTRFAQSVASAITSGVRGIVENLFFKPMEAVGKGFEEAWLKLLGVAKGELGLLFDIARSFLWQYYWATLGIYVISGVAEAFGNLDIEIEPRVLGSGLGGARFRISFKELINSFIRALREFYPNFLLGSMFGLANTILRPVEYLYRAKFVATYDGYAKQIFKDVLKPEIEQGAIINMFVEAPSITELRNWLTRMISVAGGIPVRNGYAAEIPKNIVPLLATFRAHLKLRGLPEWFIDYMSDLGQKLVVTFVDRFGKTRGVWLGEVFELPTHSELARMTQRDIFPSLYEMQKVAWTRGWNPDLTTMIYLLTFKYPSFEKLWQFYMRATAGMLWFKPPQEIAQVFSMEAQAIGAGIPVAPLDIQSKLSPDAFKAFELAINTYFKWLEYSNFSWFTPNTKLYGINVGQMIYGALGGWTADSWIMADVAADIPTKIDMRWMSRYGIFLYMADRFEKAGVTFESYKPMVQAVYALLDAQPSSTIQVDLKWFSKLIQATGLHPAWVPIVTVAENIMVISDEMTLLRTGWLNLFKEGLLTIDKAEAYLSGILTVAYQVGYWDPSTKKWTTGWINLPVRWLPHERRLLQLRFLMDRILDLYREIERYVVSGVRTIAITAEQAVEILNKAVSILNAHYKKIAKEITGREMEIAYDEEYIKIRAELFSMIRNIEAIERVRYWWYRLSGWLLYRASYGYVKPQDLISIIEDLSKIIPIHPYELEAYKIIVTKILGIVKREYVPTPSQLATLAEYIVIPKQLIEKAFEERGIPEEWRPIWEKYIEIRPIADDVRRLIYDYLKAKRYGIAIPREIDEEVKKLAQEIGFTQTEWTIRDLALQLEIMVSEASRYRQLFLPTYSFLATLGEYIDFESIPGFIDYVNKLFAELEKLGVPAPMIAAVRRYIEVRPVKSDYRHLITVAIRAYRYGVISRGELDAILRAAPQYGFTKRQLDILERVIELEVEIEQSKQYLPTPSMLATLAEYVSIPTSLVQQVLEKRHVPKEWVSIWLEYIRVKPIKSDYKSLLTAVIRAYRYGVIDARTLETYLKKAKSFGFSDIEIEIIREKAEIEVLIEQAKEYIPTPSMLATIAEYVAIPEALIKEVFEKRRVPPEWTSIWIQYIRVKPVKSDYRRLIDVAIRAFLYGAIDQATLNKILEGAKSYGFSDAEIAILRSIVELDVLIEQHRLWVPTLSMLTTIMEYVEVPREYIEKVVKERHIDPQFVAIWLRYTEARRISREVNEVISVYRRIYEYFFVTADVTRQVEQLAMRGGWTSDELKILGFELQLRKSYRIMAYLIPTIREFVRDALYLGEWEQLLEDLLRARGIDYRRWAKQVDYYRKLVKSRKINRRVSWYITRLMHAYIVGAITKEEARRRLERFKPYGLSDDEINIILEGFDLEKAYRERLHRR